MLGAKPYMGRLLMPEEDKPLVIRFYVQSSVGFVLANRFSIRILLNVK